MSQWWIRGNEAVLQLKIIPFSCIIGLVDANYRFIWTSLGAPGNTHDSTHFQCTSLWGKTLPGQVVEINGEEIPPIILGDGAFLCSLG